MIGKVVLLKKRKSCSCPTGKLCIACKNRKGVRVKPRIVIEECKPLPVPIKITTYQERPTIVQLLHKPRLWNFKQKPAPIECKTKRGTKFCQWYRRRKALKQLQQLTKLENKKLAALELEKAHHEREAEFLEQLKQRQRETRFAEPKFVIESPSIQELKRQEAVQIENARREAAEYKEQIKRLEAAEHKEQVKRSEAARIENARREREAAEYKEQVKRLEACQIENVRREREAAEYKEQVKRLEAAQIEKARREREAAEYKEQAKQRQRERRYIRPKLVTEPPTKQELKRLEAARIVNARREREAAKYKEQLKQKQKERPHVEPKLLIQPIRQEGIEYNKKQNKIKKKKGTEAKPVSESRYVTVKNLKTNTTKVPFNERFVNFCYRLCCQFYCCLSILLLITCFVIFVI